MASLNWTEPDFITAYRRQERMVVQVHYRPNLNGLQLLSGKTETKFLGEDQWQAKKHRSEHHRQ